MLQTIDIALRAASIALLVLIMAVLLRDFAGRGAARLAALLAAGTAVYAVSSAAGLSNLIGQGTFAGYGAGFWTNRDDSFGAQNRIRHGMPRDAFLAKGQFGQYVVVVPTEHLVVARFGVTGGMNDVEGVSRLVADVIAATQVSKAD